MLLTLLQGVYLVVGTNNNMDDDMLGFDKFAEKYEEIHTRSITLSGEESKFFAELKINLLQRYLKPISNKEINILDYGCGIGRSAQFIKKYFPKSSFFGVDVSQKSIDIAQKRYPKYTFSYLNKKSNLGKNKFDVIFASVVFHHIPPKERHKTIKNIHTALKKDGHLVIFEHNPYNPLTVKVVKDCQFDKGVILLKPKETKKLFLSSNFEVQRLIYYFFFPRFLSPLRKLEPLLASIPIGAQYMVIGKKCGTDYGNKS